MFNRLVACTVLSLAGVAAANAQVVQNFDLTASTASPTVSDTSTDTVVPAASYTWTLSLVSATATYVEFVPLPAALFPGPIASGTSDAGTTSSPTVLSTLHFTGADQFSLATTPGSSFDFQVALELLANGKLQTTLTVSNLGVTNDGIGFGPQPNTQIEVLGISTITPNNVPAPAGAAALLGAGGLLSIRRRRPAQA